jgi:hypothetical protein
MVLAPRWGSAREGSHRRGVWSGTQEETLHASTDREGTSILNERNSGYTVWICAYIADSEIMRPIIAFIGGVSGHMVQGSHRVWWAFPVFRSHDTPRLW